MEIQKIEKPDKKLIDQVVAIHMETFSGFFLTFMGKGFLRQLYYSYCLHPDSSLIVAMEDDGSPVGFLAYSVKLSALYKFMIKKRLFFFGWYAAGAFFRKPKVFMRLLRAFLKPGESNREEAYVELASIGVKPEAKGRGIGSRLIDYLKAHVDFSTYAYINLETDAENNDAANRFYEKNGFVLHRSFETHEGRKMNEYHFGEK